MLAQLIGEHEAGRAAADDQTSVSMTGPVDLVLRARLAVIFGWAVDTG
jgi:hypothetical protein